MFQIKRAIILFVLLMTMLTLPGTLWAGRNSKVYTGVTTARQKVSGENIQDAINKAESQALDIAIQNALATLVSRDVLAANLEFVYNSILPRAKDYIITYRVVGGVESKGYYLLGVESKVNLKRLEKRLTRARILNVSKDKPSILFFITEMTSAEFLPRYWWGKSPAPYNSIAEKIIVDEMRKARFTIRGTGFKRPDPSFYNITFSSIYDVTAAKDLGRQMKANMIVFGKVNSDEATNRMGEERAFNSRIQLDAYNLETGEKAVTSQIEAVAKSQTDEEGHSSAIAKAADLAAKDLGARLDAYWIKNLRTEQIFDLRIEGDNFHPSFLALKNRFKQMAEIENMQPKEMGADYAVMEVFYKGKPSQFANSLMLKTFDGFGMEFIEVSNHRVSIKLIAKDQGNKKEAVENKPQAKDKVQEGMLLQ